MRHLKTIAVAITAAVVAAVGTVAVAGTFDQIGSNDPVALESADTRTTTGDAEAGTTSPTDDATPGDDATSDEPATDTGSGNVDGDLISRDEAGQLAAAEIGDGAEVLRVQRDDDDGRAEYEVHLRAADGQGYEVHVDATDGTILEVERDDLSDALDRPVIEATVDRSEAEQIALAETGDGEVVAASLEEDDDRSEWEIDVRRTDGTFVEVTIDATDGTVLEVDVDD